MRSGYEITGNLFIDHQLTLFIYGFTRDLSRRLGLNLCLIILPYITSTLRHEEKKSISGKSIVLY